MIREHITVPTYLTLARLCAAPLVLPILFVALLPLNIFFVNCFLALVFVLFSLTDFLDGFLARQYHQESKLGKILDPIADKFLIYSTLVGLLAAHKIFFFWVIIFIGRDLFMMGLRYISLQYDLSIPVSQWGKVRTAMMMVYITFVIANPYQKLAFSKALWWKWGEFFLLLGALGFTVWSAKLYTEEFIHRYLEKTKEPVNFDESRDATH